MNRLICFLQTIGILLVVIGHSMYYAPMNYLFIWINSFHMPLFMFISGWLMKNSLEKRNLKISELQLFGSKGFLSSKLKRLLVPYIIISSIAFIPKKLLSSFAGRPIELSFNSWIHSLFFPWDNPIIFFWFLPTLFLIFCCVVLINKVVKCKFYGGGGATYIIDI